MKTAIECGFSSQLAWKKLVASGPTILVDIGFDETWSQGSVPNPGDRDVQALIDTGAQECFIDSELASQLNLPVVDRRAVAGTQGRHDVDFYLAQIFVPDLAFTVEGLFGGAHLHKGGVTYEVLMGRTFLEHFSLFYNGRTGRVTLTWLPER